MCSDMVSFSGAAILLPLFISREEAFDLSFATWELKQCVPRFVKPIACECARVQSVGPLVLVALRSVIPMFGSQPATTVGSDSFRQPACRRSSRYFDRCRSSLLLRRAESLPLRRRLRSDLLAPKPNCRAARLERLPVSFLARIATTAVAFRSGDVHVSCCVVRFVRRIEWTRTVNCPVPRRARPNVEHRPQRMRWGTGRGKDATVRSHRRRNRCGSRWKGRRSGRDPRRYTNRGGPIRSGIRWPAAVRRRYDRLEKRDSRFVARRGHVSHCRKIEGERLYFPLRSFRYGLRLVPPRGGWRVGAGSLSSAPHASCSNRVGY